MNKIYWKISVTMIDMMAMKMGLCVNVRCLIDSNRMSMSGNAPRKKAITQSAIVVDKGTPSRNEKNDAIPKANILCARLYMVGSFNLV